tara:strand:- start:735 stop:851 length:117 start_codon:yes stop_codon:yes gene_type:complete
MGWYKTASNSGAVTLAVSVFSERKASISQVVLYLQAFL